MFLIFLQLPLSFTKHLTWGQGRIPRQMKHRSPNPKDIKIVKIVTYVGGLAPENVADFQNAVGREPVQRAKINADDNDSHRH